MWIDEGTLKNRFPQLFTIAKYKEISVKDAYRDGEGGRKSNVEVTRNLNDWEVNDYVTFEVSMLCITK